MRVLGVNPDTKKKIVRPVYYWSHLKEFDDKNVIQIPCGKCEACRLNKSKEWSERIMLEASQYFDNCFITLTYNDQFLPKEKLDPNTHEFYNPLVKRDVQLFMKRLRKKFPDKKIRFFAAGEYGTVGNRPHYHIILFNFNFTDLKPKFYNSKTNCWTFVSPTLEELWPFGISSVGKLTTNSAAYVARYSMKKAGYGEKEFLLMSRRPGIGYAYFEQHKNDIYMTDKLYFNFSKEKKISKPSRYFDKLLEAYDLELYEEIKEKRSGIAAIFSENSLAHHNTSYLENVNSSNEEKLKKSIKSLKRSI